MESLIGLGLVIVGLLGYLIDQPKKKIPASRPGFSLSVFVELFIIVFIGTRGDMI
jgi:hypothetical protein